MKLIKFPESKVKELLSWIKNEEDKQFWSGNTFQKGLTREVFLFHLQRKDLNPFAFIGDDSSLDCYGEIVNSGENKGVLCRVIVNPAIRRKGIGKTFIKEILHWSFNQKKMNLITLNTFGHNKPARTCYQSLGFIEVALKKNYRKVGDCWRDLIVMEKRNKNNRNKIL